ncbi:MAG: hypothetical protein JWR71_2623, partial [Pseudarthrobacter sp.]|nr:hypothetical protein [Pseudarthrobacter sp.]
MSFKAKGPGNHMVSGALRFDIQGGAAGQPE